MVYLAEILAAAFIKFEIWCVATLSLSLNETDCALIWLAKHSIYCNSFNCNTCEQPCKLMTYSQGIDEKIWSVSAAVSIKASVQDHSLQKPLDLKTNIDDVLHHTIHASEPEYTVY